MFEKQKFIEEINTKGYAIIEDILENDYIAKVKIELGNAIEKEVEYHKGIDYKDYGMILVCSIYGGAFIELFDNDKLIEPINSIMGEGCIVYAYTSSSMPPYKSNYSNRIHVDCPRIIPNYITNLGVTIALDDFTEQNGATYFLPNSHNRLDNPSEKEFYGKCQRFIAKAGSVLFFNARLWHAGGDNLTNQWRHALTLNIGRPWMKQRIDIPRAMIGLDLKNCSNQALQKLGFHSQVPANYEEYYKDINLRKFKQATE